MAPAVQFQRTGNSCALFEPGVAAPRVKGRALYATHCCRQQPLLASPCCRGRWSSWWSAPCCSLVRGQVCPEYVGLRPTCFRPAVLTRQLQDQTGVRLGVVKHSHIRKPSETFR
jgi:hypothetical protein